MNSPLIALAWEIWRQGRKLVWLVLGTIAFCALINHLVPNKRFLLANFQAVYWLLMIGSLFLTFGIFHYAEYNRGKNWHGFPYRLFSLPVPTILLVMIPMFLGVVSVELVYWAWVKLVFGPLGRAVSFWPAACVGAGLLCYQAIVWSLAGFRITRIIVLASSGLVFVNLGMVPLIEEIRLWQYGKALTVSTWLLVSFSVAAFLGAWFSVERQRRGGGRGKGWLKATAARVIDALPRRTKGFASPAAAQFWFEWRRAGLMLPISAGFVLVLILVPISWLTRSDRDSFLLTVGWALALPLILSAVIGKAFVKPDFWSSDLRLQSFLAIRPFASGEMVVTKLKVAALSVALAWFQVLVFLCCYLPLWANRTDIKNCWNAFSQIFPPSAVFGLLVLGFIAAIILTWRMMVESLWVGLSGNKRIFIGSAVMHVAVAIFLVWGVVWLEHLFWTHLDQAIRNLRWIGWAVVAAAALKLSLALFSWDRVTPSRTRKYLVLWWLGTLCFVALAFLINPPFASLKHVLILTAFLPVPLARLGFAPATLAKNRHQ
jgi:hypothetical protein